MVNTSTRVLRSELAIALETIVEVGIGEFLTYHVIPGVAAYSVGLAGFQSVPTLQGSTVDVTATGYNRMVKVNDANVVAADVLASDGVVHVIDSVLLPPAAMEPQVTYLTRG
jgi:uncharacterized surface protein with fasciclin (FAS1) repeats